VIPKLRFPQPREAGFCNLRSDPASPKIHLPTDYTKNRAKLKGAGDVEKHDIARTLGPLWG
jgi:hypothetical protein